MSLYIQNESEGKLWLRNILGNIESGTQMLSAIYKKYENANGSNTLYNQLTSNQILKFDTFYDCIFIQTKSGCFFEKINIDELSNLIPYTKYYYYNPKKTTHVDYWFDETDKKIYFTDIEYVSNISLNIVFNLYLYEFDMVSGITELKTKEQINFKFKTATSLLGIDPSFETPKIAYNPDTKNYNVSFILRNNENTFGLISILIKKQNTFKIIKIDGIIPYGGLDIENSNHFSLI